MAGLVTQVGPARLDNYLIQNSRKREFCCHPRLHSINASKVWMPGTRQGMTR